MPPPSPLLRPRRERPPRTADRPADLDERPAEAPHLDGSPDGAPDSAPDGTSHNAADRSLGDAELVVARTALSQGRHQAAHALLLRTGDDWDRRGHRIDVLARESYAAARTREWLLAEPGSDGAATLLALALVHRALRGTEHPGTARSACREAARLAPADPTPWLGLLLLARASGGGDGTREAFAEVRARHPDHHHAHHLMAAHLAEHRPERGADPDHEVYAFAEQSAARAPADSPLALLPVVAHAERYRALARAGLASSDPAASGHWSGPGTVPLLQASFDWWLEWEPEDHPRRHVDLNFLAHAMCCAGRGAEAAVLFQRLDGYVTPAPWSYPDHDPHAAFRTARARVLGSGAS